MATTINPAVGDVFCKRDTPDAWKWERIMMVNENYVETRAFAGSDHFYRRNDWHAFDWVKLEVPASPADAVRVECCVKHNPGGIVILGYEGQSAADTAKCFHGEQIGIAPVFVVKPKVPVLPAVVAEPN
jgi:hypothetical protein